jgi:hypothetical protein
MLPWISGYLHEIEIDDTLQNELTVPLERYDDTLHELLNVLFTIYGFGESIQHKNIRLDLDNYGKHLLSEYNKKYFDMTSSLNSLLQVIRKNWDEFIDILPPANMLHLETFASALNGSDLNYQVILDHPLLHDFFKENLDANEHFVTTLHERFTHLSDHTDVNLFPLFSQKNK